MAVRAGKPLSLCQKHLTTHCEAVKRWNGRNLPKRRAYSKARKIVAGGGHVSGFKQAKEKAQ